MRYDKQHFLGNVKEEFYDSVDGLRGDTEDNRYRFLAEQYIGFVFLGNGDIKPLIDKILRVAVAISTATCQNFFNTEEDIAWYIAICNLSFIASRIEIRTGSRIVHWKGKVNTLHPALYPALHPLISFTVTRDEFTEQIEALVDFLNMK